MQPSCLIDCRPVGCGQSQSIVLHNTRARAHGLAALPGQLLPLSANERSSDGANEEGAEERTVPTCN